MKKSRKQKQKVTGDAYPYCPSCGHDIDFNRSARDGEEIEFTCRECGRFFAVVVELAFSTKEAPLTLRF
jgi:uncharacterized Zn finger protein